MTLITASGEESLEDELALPAYDIYERDDRVRVESDGGFEGEVWTDGDFTSADALVDAITEMRAFEEEHGSVIEFYMNTCGASIGTSTLPVEHLYVYDDGSCGVRVWTDVDGDRYGFEVMSSGEDELDLFDQQLVRSQRKMVEVLWNDKVLDAVTLDEDDEEASDE